MFVGVSHPKLIRLAKIMKDTPGEEVVMRGVGDVGVDRPVRPGGVHDCLLIVVIQIERKQKGGFLAPAQRSGERAFVVGSLLARLDDCEWIAGVEERVPIKK